MKKEVTYMLYEIGPNQKVLVVRYAKTKRELIEYRETFPVEQQQNMFITKKN